MPAEVRSDERLGIKAAIVHDWFQGFHGSERTVAAMLDLFHQEPDVYTFSAAHELLPKRLSDAIKHESRLTRLPFVRQRGHHPGRWRWLLPYMPRYFESLDLQGYDLVISSSHACAINASPRPDAIHVCYCYTPMRYLWLPDTDRGRVGGTKGRILNDLRGSLRRRDRRAAQRPDAYIAISSAVAERIRTFYERDSQVIYPPVAVEEFTPHRRTDPRSFLWVHRLVPYKHPHEVIEAFRGLPQYRLTMVGVGPLEDSLRAALPANVELLGWLPRDELRHLYQKAAGFIHIGEEDFGISMVEALAAGTPVVALKRGGATDIVKDRDTGVLVHDPHDITELRRAVQTVATREWDLSALRERAEEFSGEAFRGRLGAALRSLGAR